MTGLEQVAGFILTGGESSRMGRDKALLELGGVPLAVRTARLLEPLTASVALIGAPERYGSLGLRLVPDDQTSLGPLGGIATALRISGCKWNLILGCDLPYLTSAWLEHLIRRTQECTSDALIPESAEGHAEPLCAMYYLLCRPNIRAALARGERKVTNGLAGRRVERILPAEWKPFDSSGRLFKNMNAPEDYEEARAYFEGKQGQ